MLDQICGCSVITHTIKDDINAFAPREFRRGNEIRVGCHDNDLIDLLLESQGCDVQTQTHIDAFLLRVDIKVSIRRNEAGWRTDQSQGCALT